MDVDQVIDDIRSCLISSKGGVPLSLINRDYKMIVGHSIPYTKLGYTSLEGFLKAIPGLIVYPKGGDLVIEALPTKNTSHITAMVRGQKSSGPRRKSAPLNYGMRNIRGFRTPFTSGSSRQSAPHASGLEKGKRPAAPPPHLMSLSRANLPPRLKAQQPAPPLGTTSLNRLLSASGQRKSQEVSFNLDAEHQLEGSSDGGQQHHSSDASMAVLSNALSPYSSSVLRTPTGVLGEKKSPMASFQPEYSRRHTTEELCTPPLMSINFAPMVTPRTSAQARISRQVSLPLMSQDADVTIMPISPNYDYGSLGMEGKQQQQASMVTESKSKVYCEKLQVYCKAKHLADPVYKIIPSFPKSKTKQIVCSIKVGPDHQFSSYPVECKTEDEAREVAAQVAVGGLERIYGLLGESLPITTDENLLIDRIAQMVHDHPYGLWSLQLPADYRNLHREILPDGWLDVLRTSPLITIDHAVNDRIILLPSRATSSSSSKGRVTPTSASPVDMSGMSLTENTVSVEKGYGLAVTNGEESPDCKSGEVRSLGQICLPMDEYWNVYVSYATSTSNIWVRLIGEEYSALYDDMAAEMEMFYMDGGPVAENLTPGQFYALQVDKCWHRVEVIEVVEVEDSNEKASRFANCFFVDNGDDDDMIEVSKFRVLDARFTKLPCQAVQSRLTGLEDCPLDIEGLLVERIIGRNLVARPAPGSLEDVGDGRPYPSLTLYDTSTDENVNLNEVLLEKILSSATPPSLVKNGKIQETYVPYISKTGALFVQIPSGIFDYLTKTIDDYSSNIIADGEFDSGKVTAGVTAVFEDRMYLAKYAEDMSWYRAVKDSNNPGLEDGKIWVKFVDYGNCELTSLKDLVLLPPGHPLCRLPHQAIECRLHSMPDDLHFSSKGLKRCREIVTPEEPVLLRVISRPTDNNGRIKYEVVEIFKRVQPDNLLASVSTTLSVEEGAFEKIDEEGCETPVHRSPVKTSKVPTKPPNLPSEPGKPRALPAPRVPKVGDLFDVHVTIAANPGNFTVQPWKDASRFNELMSAIQALYSNSSTDHSISPEEMAIYRKPLKRNQVKEGSVYAALHDDQLWYRITISKLLDGPSPEEVMVSAYFVDYGDVAVMTLDKLRELAPEFYSVPYQAIKAKLAGVCPVHADWSVEDCLRFQEMVCNKQFVSTIVETGPDLIDPSDTVIGIHLTDTSDPNVDASIGQIFVEEGRALPY
ncbi:tudor domain-containing protein 7B-like [Hetaerina americana]|uniref:tudor domain-containing protein 7B-like n=1 Tax=Hetaerina americana TaxID=62018 RepID=UPI003A7F4BAF